MPKAHQEYLEWTPPRLIRWAAKTQEVPPVSQEVPPVSLSFVGNLRSYSLEIYDFLDYRWRKFMPLFVTKTKHEP